MALSDEDKLDFVAAVIQRMRAAGYGEALLGRFWDEAKAEVAKPLLKSSEAETVPCGAEEPAWAGVWDCTLPKGHGGHYHETHSRKTGKLMHRWGM